MSAQVLEIDALRRTLRFTACIVIGAMPSRNIERLFPPSLVLDFR